MPFFLDSAVDRLLPGMEEPAPKPLLCMGGALKHSSIYAIKSHAINVVQCQPLSTSLGKGFVLQLGGTAKSPRAEGLAQAPTRLAETPSGATRKMQPSSRLEAMAIRLEAIALGWRPSLLGWRPKALGLCWPSLVLQDTNYAGHLNEALYAKTFTGTKHLIEDYCILALGSALILWPRRWSRTCSPVTCQMSYYADFQYSLSIHT